MGEHNLGKLRRLCLVWHELQVLVPNTVTALGCTICTPDQLAIFDNGASILFTGDPPVEPRLMTQKTSILGGHKQQIVLGDDEVDVLGGSIVYKGPLALFLPLPVHPKEVVMRERAIENTPRHAVATDVEVVAANAALDSLVCLEDVAVDDLAFGP